jgi:hypothetical protein
MRSFCGLIALAMGSVCMPSLAQEARPGTHEVSIKQSEIDRTLIEIEAHAREFPVHFDSVQQRKDMQAELMRLLILLDGGG